MMRLKEILSHRIRIQLFLLVLIMVATSLSVPVGLIIKDKIQCKSVVSQYEEAIGVVAQLDIDARKEWDSFPVYEGGFGEDVRDPNGGGGRIYGSFEDYFQSKYGNTSDSEMRISQLLIVQNHRCFSPREVAEAQAYLNNF
jgi:hypothetical protein